VPELLKYLHINVDSGFIVAWWNIGCLLRLKFILLTKLPKPKSA